MKQLAEINLGYGDAINYRNNRRYMDMFAATFVKDEKLERLMNDDTYFLIGDKGTGKTAYAVYLENNEYKNTKSRVIEIGQTDFKLFMNFQRLGFLQLADFTRVWKIILLMNMADFIDKSDIASFGPNRSAKFEEIKNSIDNYYDNAFIPEVSGSFRYVFDSASASKAGIDISVLENIGFNLNGEESQRFQEEHNISKFQNNLLELERDYISAFSRLKIKRNRFIFIDSIDILVDGYTMEEYQTCLRGLANAILDINKGIFRSMPVDGGFLKIILAIRTDIFPILRLHNQANVIRDNSVVLDWRTAYASYRKSPLFLLCNRLLTYENDDVNENNAWDTYFPWHTVSTNDRKSFDDSFINCLKLSLSRPRDLISIMKAIQKSSAKKAGIVSELDDLISHDTQNEISNYYIDEAKDWCLHKFSDKGFKTFMFFFQFLNGKARFSYPEYEKFFKEYVAQVEARNLEKFEELKDKNDFLQLLFDLNMICYYEKLANGDEYYRFCYREREIYNLSPQVKINSIYGVHYALLKALNLGRSSTPVE